MNEVRPETTAERIAQLVEAIDAHPPSDLREQAREIVAAVLELHRAGLQQWVDCLCESGPQGRRLLDRVREDPLVGSLLSLHDLADPPPVPQGDDFVPTTRLRRAAPSDEPERSR